MALLPSWQSTRKAAFLIELKDYTKPNFEEAVDFARLLGNSKHIVTSYSSLFETLWHQTELNEHILAASKFGTSKKKRRSALFVRRFG